MKYDVCIIGCGISGASIAFELSKYKLNVVVLEKENDVSLGTSKANSAIIHAGYDPLPETKMARLNVLGSKKVEELAPLLNFHYRQIGSLVIGRKKEDKEKIDTLYERGKKNGVRGLRILSSREEILALGENNLRQDIDYALFAPTAAIVSPWEMVLAFIQNAVLNKVELKLSSKVERIQKEGEDFLVKTTFGTIRTRFIINCAGLYADEISSLASGKKEFEIEAVKGEYFLLDKEEGDLVHHVIFQTPSKVGKGVLVTPTVHGNLLVGPNALDTPFKDRVNVTSFGLDEVRQKASLTTEKIDFSTNIRNFAGNRATIRGYDDFLIEESKTQKHLIHVAGIKSPGLSSAPAFGEEVVEILKKDGVSLEKKEDYSYHPLPTYFKELSLEEKDKKIKENSLYGRVICRCETITEAEIVNAIHSPIGARTIDGVKRRCNAGMGRCQGGFCSPKVFEILQRETGKKYSEIYQDRDGSSLVLSLTKEKDS